MRLSIQRRSAPADDDAAWTDLLNGSDRYHPGGYRQAPANSRPTVAAPAADRNKGWGWLVPAALAVCVVQAIGPGWLQAKAQQDPHGSIASVANVLGVNQTPAERVTASARRQLGPLVEVGLDGKRSRTPGEMTQLAYANADADIPIELAGQARSGRPVKGGLSAAQPGDLVVMDLSPQVPGYDAAAVVLADGEMVEAVQGTGKAVKTSVASRAGVKATVRRVV